MAIANMISYFFTYHLLFWFQIITGTFFFLQKKNTKNIICSGK